jgi:hypothetical protein
LIGQQLFYFCNNRQDRAVAVSRVKLSRQKKSVKCKIEQKYICEIAKDLSLFNANGLTNLELQFFSNPSAYRPPASVKPTAPTSPASNSRARGESFQNAQDLAGPFELAAGTLAQPDVTLASRTEDVEPNPTSPANPSSPSTTTAVASPTEKPWYNIIPWYNRNPNVSGPNVPRDEHNVVGPMWKRQEAMTSSASASGVNLEHEPGDFDSDSGDEHNPHDSSAVHNASNTPSAAATTSTGMTLNPTQPQAPKAQQLQVMPQQTVTATPLPGQSLIVLVEKGVELWRTFHNPSS